MQRVEYDIEGGVLNQCLRLSVPLGLFTRLRQVKLTRSILFATIHPPSILSRQPSEGGRIPHPQYKYLSTPTF